MQPLPGRGHHLPALRELPAIEFVDGARAEALVTDDARSAARGVRLADGRVLEADLVVDASGRGSKADEWLHALGLARPEVTVVTSFLGYSSRFYRRLARAPGWTRCWFIPRRPRPTAAAWWSRSRTIAGT